MSEQRPTYRIPTGDVVPGMILCACEYRWPVLAAGRHDDGAPWLEVDRGDYKARRYGFRADDVVTVELAGRSPRELACTCEAWEPELSPASHGDDCRVAPVPGENGGLRLWPAPFNGNAWTWDLGAKAWTIGRKIGEIRFIDRNDIEVATRGWHEQGINDVILHCFYLPPAPQPDRGEPTPWAPHAGYEDLAVRYG